MPAPWIERRDHLLKQWAGLTVQLQDADITTLGRTVRAAEEALKKGDG